MGSHITGETIERSIGQDDLAVPDLGNPPASAGDGGTDRPASGWDKNRQAADQGKAREQREALAKQVGDLTGLVTKLSEQVTALTQARPPATPPATPEDKGKAKGEQPPALPDLPDLDEYSDPADIAKALGAVKAHIQALRDGGGDAQAVQELRQQVADLSSKLTAKAEDDGLKAVTRGLNQVYGEQYAADALAATQSYFKSRNITNPGDELQATRLELEYARLSGRGVQQPAPSLGRDGLAMDSGTGAGSVPTLGQCRDVREAVSRLKSSGFRLNANDLGG